MSEKKSLRGQDLSGEVDKLVPEFLDQYKKNSGEFQNALNDLLNLEKKTRLAEDGKSTTKVVQGVIKLCYEKKDWLALNEHLIDLSKKRLQMQQVIQGMVQEAMTLLDKTPDRDVKLALITTLREISAGKMVVELERARLTRMLAEMKEAEGKVADAGDIMQEVQVETIGAMEVREKAAFFMEQIRLCLAKKDYIRAEIVANKVNTKVLAEESYQELKIKFYTLMIQYYSHSSRYFDICKAFREIYNTPSVQSDPAQWKPALTQTVVFLLLSPWDAEVSDVVHRIKADKRIAEMPTLQHALNLLTTDELMRWPLPFEGEWKKNPAFTGEKAKEWWDDLHKRVVQHNIRVIGKFYSLISTKRIAQLLLLDERTSEAYLSEMVSSKQLFAKVDRPKGTIAFEKNMSDSDVVDKWSNDVSDLLTLVEKTCHMIAKENMIHKIA